MYTFITTFVGHKNPKPENFDNLSVEEKIALTDKGSEYEMFSTYRNGKWSEQACINAAKRMGFIGEVTCSYQCIDTSGMGRGGTDKEFTVTI